MARERHIWPFWITKGNLGKERTSQGKHSRIWAREVWLYLKRAGNSSAEVILLLNFTEYKLITMKERNYKILKDRSGFLVAFSFLSEMGGLKLCTGECLSSFMKLSSQMATSSGYRENSNLPSFPCLSHSNRWQVVTKEDVNSTGLWRTSLLVWFASRNTLLLQRGFLLSLLQQDLQFSPTNPVTHNTTWKNISVHCTILPRHVDKPLTVTVAEIALWRQNEVTEQEKSCKNYSAFISATLIAV